MNRPRMRSELFTVRGVTGAAASGTLDLDSDLLYGAAAHAFIQIPKGCMVKVWAKSLTHWGANPITMSVRFQHDHAVAVYVTLGTEKYDPAVSDTIDVEKRRPIVARGFTGEEAISFYWTEIGGAAGGAVASFEIEVLPVME